MHFIARDLATLALAAALVGGCTAIKRYLYEGGDRDRWQQPEKVVASLGLRPGSHVADIGAGGGYFTFRLADAVGPDGKIYAIDIDKGMTDYIANRAREEGRLNIASVLAERDDPLLPPSGVDLVFTCNTFHHLEDRVAYFERIRANLRPGGRLAIIEYKPYGWFPRLFGHHTSAETIRAEMETAGYGFREQHEFLERQSFLVFARESP